MKHVVLLWVTLLMGFLLLGCLGNQNDKPATSGELQQFQNITTNQISQIDSKMTVINSQLETINQDIDNIQVRTGNIETSVSSIENKVSTINSITNNLIIYSVTISITFTLVFNLAWKLFENHTRIVNDFGGIIGGFAIALIIFVLLLIFGIARLTL